MSFLQTGHAIWQHLVRGTKYQIHSTECRVQCPDDQPLRDGEMVLLYQNIDDGSWSVRRAAEFHDGRFVPFMRTP